MSTKDKKRAGDLKDLAKVIEDAKTPEEKVKDKAKAKKLHKQKLEELTESARLERVKKREEKYIAKGHASYEKRVADLEARGIEVIKNWQTLLADNEHEQRNVEIMAARSMAGEPIELRA